MDFSSIIQLTVFVVIVILAATGINKLYPPEI